MTSFRLFSHLRHDRQSGWEAVGVEAGGREHRLAIRSLGHGLRGFGFAMAEFTGAASDRRDELCRTWFAAAKGAEPQTREVRLYRLSWRLSERTADGDRPLPPHRTLAYVCSRRGSREARA